MPATQIAVRLPDDVLSVLDAVAESTQMSRAEIVRRALLRYVARLQAEHDAAIYERMPLTDEEIAFSADPRNWEGLGPW